MGFGEAKQRTFEDLDGLHERRDVRLEQIVARAGHFGAHVCVHVVQGGFEVLEP